MSREIYTMQSNSVLIDFGQVIDLTPVLAALLQNRQDITRVKKILNEFCEVQQNEEDVVKVILTGKYSHYYWSLLGFGKQQTGSY